MKRSMGIDVLEWDEAATDRRQRAPPDPWEGVDPPAPGA
jgi:hypothetical protein